MTTKEKILVATLELASEKGLGGVSLSQIAKKVGIQKPSLYNHFTSKDEIILSLYEYLRMQAKEMQSPMPIDYRKLVKGKKAFDILNQTVHSYISMNQNLEMEQFYKFIMSERCLKKEAAKIMIIETEKMIDATRELFCAMQEENVMTFENIDIEAFSFAMTIHSIMDYMNDQKMAGETITANQKLEEYLTYFCNKNN